MLILFNHLEQTFRIVYTSSVIDRDFFEKIFEILKEEYFTSDAHNTIWLEIRKLFNKYNAPPTYDTLKTEISQYPEGELKSQQLMYCWILKQK